MSTHGSFGLGGADPNKSSSSSSINNPDVLGLLLPSS